MVALSQTERNLLSEGKKIAAIKELRARKQISLADAKDIVEMHQNEFANVGMLTQEHLDFWERLFTSACLEYAKSGTEPEKAAKYAKTLADEALNAYRDFEATVRGMRELSQFK